MTTTTTQKTRAVQKAVAKPIDTVRAVFERMKPELERVLPRHVTSDQLCRVAITAINTNPKLLECDRNSLYAALMSCAQLGIVPDGILGQGYLVPFAKRVTLIVGYKGLIMLARNSGEVKSISAHEVRENDTFHYQYGLNERCDHHPAEGDRGEITFFYAVCHYKDGGYNLEVLSRAEVEATRDRSPGWVSAKRYNNTKDSPWETNFDAMGKKTAIRRLAKFLPLTVQKAVALEQAYDEGRPAYIDRHGEIIVEPAPEAVAKLEAKGGIEKSDPLDKFGAEGETDQKEDAGKELAGEQQSENPAEGASQTPQEPTGGTGDPPRENSPETGDAPPGPSQGTGDAPAQTQPQTGDMSVPENVTMPKPDGRFWTRKSYEIGVPTDGERPLWGAWVTFVVAQALTAPDVDCLYKLQNDNAVNLGALAEYSGPAEKKLRADIAAVEAKLEKKAETLV